MCKPMKGVYIHVEKGGYIRPFVVSGAWEGINRVVEKGEMAGKKKLSTQIVNVSLQLIILVPISGHESLRELNSGVPSLKLKFSQWEGTFCKSKGFSSLSPSCFDAL